MTHFCGKGNMTEALISGLMSSDITGRCSATERVSAMIKSKQGLGHLQVCVLLGLNMHSRYHSDAALLLYFIIAGSQIENCERSVRKCKRF